MQIAKAKTSMKHSEVVIARQAVEEGRALVVIVNKMDLLRGKHNSILHEKIIKAVPQEIQTVLPQVCLSNVSIMYRGDYKRWQFICVMSRHSWKDQATQPKIKYFTQVKARPPTFVAFLSGKTHLSDTDIRFLTKSLKEDFDLGGIPIRITQHSVPRKAKHSKKNKKPSARMNVRILSEKRVVSTEQLSS
ncbi:hypothetical protein B296_00017128 [Ensete ventricosum]|uniref:GTPase Der C-terminal KH-domain-like domain-containing protein n=1 Tax=Ensete ventricosum TaxID=4639 RepID=A0A427B5A0_ENSVE|nr:hypothetical protein B296_00017128 [Ensete ventricosum]